ncbi:MAG TPA: hypothetical protein VE988_00280 [Gemmataceae bacterium]|nr:hypothetical protein [Gemmataceae bacterium]
MLSLPRILLVVTAMAITVGSGHAQTSDKPKPADAAKDYRWEDEAKKHEMGLFGPLPTSLLQNLMP